MQIEHSPDQLTGQKTIYDVNAWEIIWRNLLAGMSRALGNILMYFLFLFVAGFLFSRIVYPHLKPYLDLYTTSLESLGALRELESGGSGNVLELRNLNPNLDKNAVQEILQQFQSESNQPN